MPDIAIARPFTFNAADGLKYEFGIALYSNMTQEFVDDPYVQAHSEAAILAAGRLLFQQRTIVSGSPPSPIFLSPEVNGSIYPGGIQSGWPPLFRDDIDIDLEHPYDDDPNRGRLGVDWAGRHDRAVLRRFEIEIDQFVQSATMQEPQHFGDGRDQVERITI